MRNCTNSGNLMLVPALKDANALFQEVREATTADGKGKSLERLVREILEQVPGITFVQARVKDRFGNDELDLVFRVVAVKGGLPEAAPFLTSPYLPVECKNWQPVVGSPEVSAFAGKLEAKRLPFGVLIATNGISGKSGEGTAAFRKLTDAAANGRRIAVLSLDDLERCARTEDVIETIVERAYFEIFPNPSPARSRRSSTEATPEDVRSHIKEHLRRIRPGGRSFSRQQLAEIRTDAARIYEFIEDLRARETPPQEDVIDDIAGSVDGVVDSVERLDSILGPYYRARRRRRQPSNRETLREIDNDHAVYVERAREVIASLEDLDLALRSLSAET